MAQGNDTIGLSPDQAAAATAFDFQLYHYDPSLPAAVVAVAVFAILTVLHVLKVLRHRSLYFTPFVVGVQTFGYCGRIWSHFDRQAIGGFIVQAILILIAPALYAASIYMILGRLISAVGAENLSPVPLQWLTKIFVTADMVSFLLQAGGGGIQAGGTLDLFQIGEKIIIAGLFVQIAFFGFFVITAVQFHRRLLVHAGHPLSSTGSGTTIPWKKHLYVLYTVSSIILIRSIFRVVEYLQGNSGYLISHELFLYIFDTLLMVLVMVIFLIFYIDDLYLGLASERSGDEEAK